MCKRNLVMSHISKLEMSHQVDLSVYGEACKYGIVCNERERTTTD